MENPKILTIIELSIVDYFFKRGRGFPVISWHEAKDHVTRCRTVTTAMAPAVTMRSNRVFVVLLVLLFSFCQSFVGGTKEYQRKVRQKSEAGSALIYTVTDLKKHEEWTGSESVDRLYANIEIVYAQKSNYFFFYCSN